MVNRMFDRISVGVEFEFVFPHIEKRHPRTLKRWEDISIANYEYRRYEVQLENWERGRRKRPPVLPSYLNGLPYKPGEEIPEPEDIFGSLDKKIEGIFKKTVENYLHIQEMDFSNFLISTNPETKPVETWVIKPDNSLSPCGVEIASPPMKMSELIPICDNLFCHISDHATTNDDCGFHISISIDDVNLLEKIDLVKLALLVDEDKVFELFPERIDNPYVIPVYRELKRHITRDMLRKHNRWKLYEVQWSYNRNMAINIQHLADENKYIEFRYVGGDGYHKRMFDCCNMIYHFSECMIDACDKRRKERFYLEKLKEFIKKTY